MNPSGTQNKNVVVTQREHLPGTQRATTPGTTKTSGIYEVFST